MNAYIFDENGRYTLKYSAQLDPIATQKSGREVYLLPASATFLPPPGYNPETEIPVWDGEQWAVEALPEPDPEPEPTPEPEPAPEYVTYSELAAAIREGANAV